MLDRHGQLVDDKERYRVLVSDSTFVPVVGDALIPHCVLEATRIPSYGEEGFEGIPVQVAFRILRRLVAHKTVDEGERRQLDRQTGERAVKKVGVVVYRVLETLCAELGEGTDIVPIRPEG